MSYADTSETPIENDQRHSVADLVMQFGALIALRVSPALGGDEPDLVPEALIMARYSVKPRFEREQAPPRTRFELE